MLACAEAEAIMEQREAQAAQAAQAAMEASEEPAEPAPMDMDTLLATVLAVPEDAAAEGNNSNDSCSGSVFAEHGGAETAYAGLEDATSEATPMDQDEDDAPAQAPATPPPTEFRPVEFWRNLDLLRQLSPRPFVPSDLMPSSKLDQLPPQVQAFRVTPNYWAQKNPHPRDQRLVFLDSDNDYHHYFIDGEHAGVVSVSGLLCAVFGGFDVVAHCARLVHQKNWLERKIKKTKYSAFETVDEVPEHYNHRRILGTRLHANCEDIACGKQPEEIEAENSHLVPKFKEWLRNCPLFEEYEILRCEWGLFDEDAQVCGTGDLFLVHKVKRNHVIIIDIKRCNDIGKDFPRGKCPYPCERLNLSKHAKYSLQISLYAYMAETKYGVVVDAGYLLQFRDGQRVRKPVPELVSVPLLREEAAAVMAFRRKAVELASDPESTQKMHELVRQANQHVQFSSDPAPAPQADDNLTSISQAAFRRLRAEYAFNESVSPNFD